MNTSAEFPAFVGGFGSGKTAAGILRALKLKWQYPQQDIAYYLPTYDLVRMIGYPRVQAMLRAIGARQSLNKAEHVLSIRGRGRIVFRTLDNPDRIVGYEVADSVVDELDTLKPDLAAHAWRQIIARNRQKKPDRSLNTVAVATTPEGFRFVYERWQANPAPGYELIKASTYSNARNLPAGYIDALRRSYPAKLIDAYIEGEFVNLTAGAVYPDFSRELNHTPETIAAGEPLHVGMDFNVNNMTACVHVLRFGRPLLLAELTEVRDTPAMVRALKERFGSHEVTVYPDASGGSTKTVNASESDLTILRDAGFALSVGEANPRVRDRINAVNGQICNSLGERNYRVNTVACPVSTKAFEQQVYRNGEPDKTGGHDHPVDAAGYFLVRRFPIHKPASTTGLIDYYDQQARDGT